MAKRVPMPRTVAGLWRQGWVAETEDEAITQAERMFELFADKRVRVDRLTFPWGGECDEWMFRRPWPEVWVNNLSTDSGWDGDVLYAEWYVRPANPDQIVTAWDGEKIRLGDVDDIMTTTAPGIGTEAGFSSKDALVFPIREEANGRANR